MFGLDRFDFFLVESIVGKNVERLNGLLNGFIGRLLLLLLNRFYRFYDVEVVVEKMIDILFNDFGI